MARGPPLHYQMWMTEEKTKETESCEKGQGEMSETEDPTAKRDSTETNREKDSFQLPDPVPLTSDHWEGQGEGWA